MRSHRCARNANGERWPGDDQRAAQPARNRPESCSGHVATGRLEVCLRRPCVCPTPLFELRRGLAVALRAKAESPGAPSAGVLAVGLPSRSSTREISGRRVATTAGLPSRSGTRKKSSRSAAKAGAPGRTRTCDPRLRRRVVSNGWRTWARPVVESVVPTRLWPGSMRRCRLCSLQREAACSRPACVDVDSRPGRFAPSALIGLSEEADSLVQCAQVVH